MIRSEFYKLYPYINNSFDDTIKEYSKYLISQYNINDIRYSTIKIDTTKIGSSFSDLKTPKYIYITVNYLTNKNWTNSGGIEYCELKNCDMIISIRWDTAKTNLIYFKNEIKKLPIGFFRKLKLQKLSDIK